MNEDCVLIIQHDVLVRHPLADYLRECGFRVVETVSYDEARAVLIEGSRRIDVVLADAQAPDQQGFAFASWLRSTHPDIELLLAASVAQVVEHAGELCEEGPTSSMAPDYREVFDRIRRSLAARERQK
jgi:DNA-binding response OmpR family regulator